MIIKCERCRISIEKSTSRKYCTICAKQVELERKRINNKRWRLKNPNYWKKWRENNPGKKQEYDKKYYDPELGSLKNRKYYARKRNAKGNYTSRDWKNLCAQFNHCCACCGKQSKLEADHIIPLIKGGSNYISNIQPLCKSCNSSKMDQIIDYR